MKRNRFKIYCLLCLFYAGSCGTDSTESYKLFTFVDPQDGGTIEPAGGEFQMGETVVIEAIPLKGWKFRGWA